jgi:phosphatidylglycerol---prolipoprotein diacylglyceryl transferase
MINWDVSPLIFEIGFLKLRWYGLLFALSFVIGYQIIERVFKREGKPLKDLESLTMTMVLSTVIGARLGHCLFYSPEYYLANPLKILMVWEGGLASHGGTIGILIGLWLFTRKRKNFDYMWLLDRIAWPTALSASLIRLGNLFNSEILGRATDVSWAFVFARVDSIPRHPPQLYESISYFVIFIIMTLMYLKKGKGGEKIKPGKLLGVFLTLVFSARFFIEFIKENQVGFEQSMTLNMGQILSIPFVIVGLYLLFLFDRNKIK